MRTIQIRQVEIGGRVIGPGHPCFIIAEAGVNHNGETERALQLIDAAASAGADAVKFQAFHAEQLVTKSALKASYQLKTTQGSDCQYEMLKALELSTEQQAALKKHCEKQGLIYLCTPYDNDSADMLDELQVAAFKVASTDTTNIPYLRHLAKKRRPIILSTGMSNLCEIESAMVALREDSVDIPVVLMHCTTEYPARSKDLNLRAMAAMTIAFNCPVGFSDHTPGIGASPWAVAYGAVCIEKHFTMSRSQLGPDHKASIEPLELVELVRTIREVEAALGDGIKRPVLAELTNKPRMQKSLVAECNIPKGSFITEQHLACKRPGDGLSPSWLYKIVGKRAARTIEADALLSMGDVEW